MPAPLRSTRTALSKSFSQPVIDERWRQIFEGACVVIAEKGFAKATIREIAAAAKMPIPTMYQYLERKEDLLHQIYEYFMTDIMVALHEVRASTLPPRERLEELVRTMIHLFDKHHKYIKLMFQETRALTPEARQRVYELDASYIAVISELIDDTIAQCGWRERNTELTANFLYFLCCIWPLRHWTIAKFGEQAVAGEIVDLMLNGLSGQAALRGRQAGPATPRREARMSMLEQAHDEAPPAWPGLWGRDAAGRLSHCRPLRALRRLGARVARILPALSARRHAAGSTRGDRAPLYGDRIHQGPSGFKRPIASATSTSKAASACSRISTMARAHRASVMR